MQSTVDQIIAASVSGNLQEVSALLDAEPDLVNATNMFGSSAIHAAHYSGHPGIVNLLFARGRVLDVFLAAELGMANELRIQLDRESSLAAQFGASGATALHGACYWGSVAAARVLLERGADVNAFTRDSFLRIAPIGCAVATPNVPNPSDDESVVVALVELLLAHGANVNAQRRDGMTALHAAAYRGHLKVIETLLKAGADSRIRAHADSGAHSGETPLDTAVAQGQDAAAAALRDAGRASARQ
jgi:ankyrin repeat protein